MFNKISYYGVVVLGVFGLMACASQETAESHASANVEGKPVMSTVKPGASIAFTSITPKDLQVSETGRIKINITDGYYSGTMRLTAVPEDGLRFVSETGRKEFSMAGANTHEWELDVTASAKGVYYVNVFAEAVTSQMMKPQFRSYAVRVQVGDLTDAELKGHLKSNGTVSSDGTVVIMSADEVIK